MQTKEIPIKKQLSQLEQHLNIIGKRKWVILKINKSYPYAYCTTTDTLHRLEVVRDENHNKVRWEDGCLKYKLSKKSIWTKGKERLIKMSNNDNEILVIPNEIEINETGANGIGQNFVKGINCIFTELDQNSLDEQWKQIQDIESELGLTPTAVIFSGNKSLHIYYQLTESCTDKARAKRVQQKLCCVLSGDPATVNADRAMRLAGVKRNHKKTQQSIEYTSNKTYDIDELEDKLNQSQLFPYGLDNNRFREYKRRGKEALLQPLPENNAKPIPPDHTQLQKYESHNILLRRTLNREKERLITTGAKTHRNSTGFNLACTLIETENWLQKEGINYNEYAYNLFIEYCHNCSSGGNWNEIEWQQIWLSASIRWHQKTHIDEEQLIKRINYLQRESLIKEGKKTRRKVA